MKTCYACAYSYMEPDSPLICGHNDSGPFGKHLNSSGEVPLKHCNFEKFEQHPLRNEDGSLKKDLGKEK